MGLLNAARLGHVRLGIAGRDLAPLFLLTRPNTDARGTISKIQLPTEELPPSHFQNEFRGRFADWMGDLHSLAVGLVLNDRCEFVGGRS